LQEVTVAAATVEAAVVEDMAVAVTEAAAIRAISQSFVFRIVSPLKRKEMLNPYCSLNHL
jgi:large-conductance mechanosensitive channel